MVVVVGCGVVCGCCCSVVVVVVLGLDVVATDVTEEISEFAVVADGPKTQHFLICKYFSLYQIIKKVDEMRDIR